MPKIPLLGKTILQLDEIVRQLGMVSYTARQIADWVYKTNIFTIGEMSNISMQNREKLSEQFEIGRSGPVKTEVSADGSKKYLYKTAGGRFFEAAFIPESTRNTICVSSQVGCKMGCNFCLTGSQGFSGQLTAGEIVNQIISLPNDARLTNVVYMGMGEPLDNLEPVLQSLEILTAAYGLGLSPRRITVSTVGVVPAMKVLLEKSMCNLAVSLNSPFAYERQKLMPVERIYPLEEVINTIKDFSSEKQKRISFEYIVFEGINHSAGHVKELSRKLNGLRCHINLISFHPFAGSHLKPPHQQTLVEFRNALQAKGITTTIRKSRGQDINAACGMLSTKNIKPSAI